MEDNVKKAIEESFPIVEINRLAIPERNAFKPIYQIHKWFARRASCVFRAILLASMKPSGADIMAEFYEDHTDDSDTKSIRILDPFMGGGTTIVEALRLGCNVTGIDLNPVAWFIVKTEVEMVDISNLRSALKRLEDRSTLNGKPIKEELRSYYKTECPCCGAGREEADIIYTFWVKLAICTNPTCKKQVPLYQDYIIGKNTPSISYIPDYKCGKCKKTFDLELERASLIAEESLMKNNDRDAAGDKRANRRWAALDPTTHSVKCPWCFQISRLPDVTKLVKNKKKIPLAVLLCPHCYTVWQCRGSVPEYVICPTCSKSYNPHKGNIPPKPSKGKFLCPYCGNIDKIINAIRRLPQDQRLQSKRYAIEGYCSVCAGDIEIDEINLYGKPTGRKEMVTHLCNIKKNRGKFFKKITPADSNRYNKIERIWSKEKDKLSYPKSNIPEGDKTKTDLIGHHYNYWFQLFNSRQLLSLAILIKGIQEEENSLYQEMLLSAFFQTLRNQCMLCFYNLSANKLEPAMSGHDFRDPNTICENSVWGTKYGRGTFSKVIDKLYKGKSFNIKPFDRIFDGLNERGNYKTVLSESHEKINGLSENCQLFAEDSKKIDRLIPDAIFDYVITDPPYAGNVNYSELSDFFYVWLRLVLSKKYKCFAPEYAPKFEEVIQNKTRDQDLKEFQEGLRKVFYESSKLLKDEGLLVFTFHHEANEAWVSVLEAIFKANLFLVAVYPYESDAKKGGALGAQKIAYDTIHVCRKRIKKTERKQRSWAGIREDIRKKARKEIEMIEGGRYGKEKLSPADVNIILIGKCLELYSEYYGLIVDYKGDIVPLEEALVAIRVMVEQIVSTQQPLPSELEHIDPVSYIYLTCLCDRKEIKSDEVHKTTRGIMEPEVLIKAGVIRKGRAKRGRTYEVKLPVERYKDLEKLFKKTSKSLDQLILFPELEEAKFDRIALVDVLHYLMGLAEAGETLVPWLKQFQSAIPNIRASFDYLLEKNPTFQNPIKKVLSIVEV